MNVFTQAVLYWTLLGLLLVWMVICAILALRPEPKKPVRTMRDEAPSALHSFTLNPAPAMLQVISPQPVAVTAQARNSSNDVAAESNQASLL